VTLEVCVNFGLLSLLDGSSGAGFTGNKSKLCSIVLSVRCVSDPDFPVVCRLEKDCRKYRRTGMTK
jgi:hypothetical protein